MKCPCEDEMYLCETPCNRDLCAYQQGYQDGGSDMEQAKQIIIDGLLEQIKVLEKKMISRPIELYAVEDCISGEIIFNARGGCYKEVADANDKISRLLKEHSDKSYKIVTYRLQ